MRRMAMGVVAGLVAVGGALGQGGGENLPRPETFGIKAVTRPSRDAIMGFAFPTSVLELLASDGEVVNVGQPLVRADDRESASAVELQQIRAESTLDVDAEVKARELADVELAATEQAFTSGGGSTLERDRARLNSQTAALRVDASKLRLREQRIQLEQLELRHAKHTLKAPFDGVVESVVVSVGDAVRESDPVIRVVSVDPLWIDVATPTEATLGLEAGDPAWCLVRIGDDVRVLAAKIEGVSPVADSVTGARRVRVEAPNPEGLPAGLTVFVRFNEPDEAWAGLARADEGAGSGG